METLLEKAKGRKAKTKRVSYSPEEEEVLNAFLNAEISAVQAGFALKRANQNIYSISVSFLRRKIIEGKMKIVKIEN